MKSQANQLTTKDFERAGMPFEWFLRYAQLLPENKAKFESLFAKKYPNGVNNETTQPDTDSV